MISRDLMMTSTPRSILVHNAAILIQNAAIRRACAAAACQTTRNVKRLTSRARACVPLRVTADPFEGIEKTMLPLRFWRGWGRKRAPHQRATPTPAPRQGHVRAAPEASKAWEGRHFRSLALPGGSPRLGGVEHGAPAAVWARFSCTDALAYVNHAPA